MNKVIKKVVIKGKAGRKPLARVVRVQSKAQIAKKEARKKAQIKARIKADEKLVRDVERREDRAADRLVRKIEKIEKNAEERAAESPAEREFNAKQQPLFKKSVIKGSRAATEKASAGVLSVPATVAAKNGKASLPAVRKPEPPPMIVLEAKALEVVDSVSQKKAVELIGRLKALAQKITDDYKPQLISAKNTIKEINAAAAEKIDPLLEAELILRDRDRTYYLKQKEIADKAEEVRIAKERELERKQRIERAGELMEQGKSKEAQRLLAAPSDVEKRPPAKPATPEGSQARDTPWKWRLKNPDSLVGIPLDFLMLDEVKLNRLVRAEGKKAEEVIAVIEVYKDVTLAYDTAVEVTAPAPAVEVHTPAHVE